MMYEDYQAKPEIENLIKHNFHNLFSKIVITVYAAEKAADLLDGILNDKIPFPNNFSDKFIFLAEDIKELSNKYGNVNPNFRLPIALCRIADQLHRLSNQNPHNQIQSNIYNALTKDASETLSQYITLIFKIIEQNQKNRLRIRLQFQSQESQNIDFPIYKQKLSSAFQTNEDNLSNFHLILEYIFVKLNEIYTSEWNSNQLQNYYSALLISNIPEINNKDNINEKYIPDIFSLSLCCFAIEIGNLFSPSSQYFELFSNEIIGYINELLTIKELLS